MYYIYFIKVYVNHCINCLARSYIGSEVRQFELENKKAFPDCAVDAADPGSILSFGRFGGTSGCKLGFD